MDSSKRIGKCIFDTAHQLKVILDASFEDADLNGLQARILGFVEHNNKSGKSVYQRDIEAEFKIRRSSVSSVLDTMEKNGYIIRCQSRHDARLKQILLTEKADKMGQQHRDAIDRFEENLTKNISVQETETLKYLLNKVLENAAVSGGDKDD
ncbi:MAG: winged helix-turn-helix transcriptional regulator [Oscillospiraceae bacterium]|nr:winged helix-turn-helix transcriptional regulator [Oscillospiraceae bacterium]